MIHIPLSEIKENIPDDWFEKADKALELDFGHSGIDPLQTRHERAGVVLKFREVWWEGRHHEITQPPMPLP